MGSHCESLHCRYHPPILFQIHFTRERYNPHLYAIANHVTLTTTSSPRCSPPGYLNVHMPSRLTSQKAPEAECIPRLPASPDVVDLSTRPCWTMVLLTVKRNGGGVFGVDGAVALMRDWRMWFCEGGGCVSWFGRFIDVHTYIEGGD